jgi:hypothetical protein
MREVCVPAEAHGQQLQIPPFVRHEHRGTIV